MISQFFIPSLPEPSKKEILRYARGDFSPETNALLDSCIKESEGKFSFKACARVCELFVDGDTSFVDGVEFLSRDLAKNLEGSSRVLVFAASIGVEIDRLILKYSKISPARALIFQALGAERVEALADEFLRDFSEKNRVFLKPRFSAGYGDLSLSAQKEIFGLISPEKNIGVYLNDSLIMTPSKSITAFVGIKEDSK